MSKKNKIGGLAQFLSTATVNSSQENASAENIVKIDIGKLVPDPYNMYGLRDIDSLAGMIASNHFHLEAIEVRPMDDGRYMIISGHRRRAAWEMLLETGETNVREVPCVIRRFEDMHIKVNNNGATQDAVITAEQQANFSLILANCGQRKDKTIEEEIWEIEQLEPYVKLLYNQQGKPKGRGQFKSFFASVLNINPSALQRKKNLLRLIPRARLALHDREINLSVAVEISGLPKEEQDKVLDDIFSGAMENTYKAIVAYKQSLKNEDNSAGEQDDTVQADTDTNKADSSGSGFQNFDEPEDVLQDKGEDYQSEGDDGTSEADEEESVDDDTYSVADDTSGQASVPSGNDSRQVKSKEDSEVPEPPNTGNPQNDTHKWFMEVIAPEIKRLEAIKEHCTKMKEKFDELSAQGEKGAALKAARWESCRSYLTVKILALTEKD